MSNTRGSRRKAIARGAARFFLAGCAGVGFAFSVFLLTQCRR